MATNYSLNRTGFTGGLIAGYYTLSRVRGSILSKDGASRKAGCSIRRLTGSPNK